MLTDLKITQITRDGGLRDLDFSIDFTATLNGIPVIARYWENDLIWLDPSEETFASWTHVVSDEREGYVYGDTFVSADDYTAAWRQIKEAAWEALENALRAVDAWAEKEAGKVTA